MMVPGSAVLDTSQNGRAQLFSSIRYTLRTEGGADYQLADDLSLHSQLDPAEERSVQRACCRSPSVGVVPQLALALTARTVRAAIEDAVTLHAVTDDATLTVFTTGSERMYSALEAVEGEGPPLMNHGEGSLVIVVAHFASRHVSLLKDR